jgi:hypothetical protein
MITRSDHISLTSRSSESSSTTRIFAFGINLIFIDPDYRTRMAIKDVLAALRSAT